MKKLLLILLYIALGMGNAFAGQSNASTDLLSKPHAKSPAKSGNAIRHRGPNPAMVGGAAKSAGAINGKDIHPNR